LVSCLAELEVSAGNWTRAEELISDLAEINEGTVAFEVLSGVRGLLNVLRGQLETGLHNAEQGFTLASAMQLVDFVVLNARVIGLANLSIGDAAAAHAHLAPITSMAEDFGMLEPGVLRFLPDDIESLIRIGDLDQAGRLLDSFEANSQRLSRISGNAASYRCRGLLLAARGNLNDACDFAGRSAELFRQLGLPFELGRSQLVVGEILRRARRKRLAHDALTSAEAIFAGLGSPIWEQRAHEEQLRIGMRIRRDIEGGIELTNAERRVADLVVVGLTNREVAEKLFMAQRTVEAHLTKIFRKLGVRSRLQLAKVYTSHSA